MSDPAIKAALEQAGEAVRIAMMRPGCCMAAGAGCELPPCHCATVAAAAAVAAFLRSPGAKEFIINLQGTPWAYGTLDGIEAFAAAVEKEAADDQ